MQTTGVNQPAINYHFGGKEELYLACASEILADYILVDNLWPPGIELASALIAAIKGRVDTYPSDRIDAIMMISGIAAFVPRFSVAQEIMRRNKADTEVNYLVLERLNAQIDSWVLGHCRG